MKIFLKKLFIMLFVFIISTLIIFSLFTFKSFFSWCTRNQILMFDISNYNNQFDNLDSFKLNGLDMFVKEIENNSNNINPNYNPTGYAVWLKLQSDVWGITKYYKLSIFLGLSIAVCYTIIFSKKLNTFLKILFGYISIMIIMPILYYYTYNPHIMAISDIKNCIIYFGIIYTVIFVLMYLTNYILKKKRT